MQYITKSSDCTDAFSHESQPYNTSCPSAFSKNIVDLGVAEHFVQFLNMFYHEPNLNSCFKLLALNPYVQPLSLLLFQFSSFHVFEVHQYLKNLERVIWVGWSLIQSSKWESGGSMRSRRSVPSVHQADREFSLSGVAQSVDAVLSMAI